MSILIDANTRLITQGITGKAGLFHTQRCAEYGTKVVGGVTPKKGGSKIEGFPVFNSVAESVKETGANVSMVFVPPFAAGAAIIEAMDAGIQLVVAITEGIPVHDMLKVREAMKKHPEAILLGPNCPGAVNPGICKVGISPGPIHKKGRIGVVSRSGTLTYEAVFQTSQLGLGQSAAIGIGGDPVHGLSHVDVLKMFNEDSETEAIVVIGEIGGTDEEEAASYIKEHVKKPCVGFIAGASAPPGKRMGHAGAIVSGGSGTAASKIAALISAGVRVSPTAAEIGATMMQFLKERGMA